MELVEINEDNIEYVYHYLNSLNKTYLHLVKLEDFKRSFFHDISEGEYMFKELYAYAYFDVDHKVKALIQYGIPNYEINYDGERNYDSKVGCIRLLEMDFLHQDNGKALYNRAISYFKEKGIHKVYASSNDYGLSCYGYQNKTLKNEYLKRFFWKHQKFQKYVTSSFYTISLKRMKPYNNDDYITFKEDKLEQNHQFFTILKGLNEIGGLEVFYIGEKCVYLNFIYILDDYRGRYWGQQAFMAALMMFRKLGYDRLDSELLTDNVLAIKMYTYAKLGKINQGFSYIKEI